MKSPNNIDDFMFLNRLINFFIILLRDNLWTGRVEISMFFQVSFPTVSVKRNKMLKNVFLYIILAFYFLSILILCYLIVFSFNLALVCLWKFLVPSSNSFSASFSVSCRFDFLPLVEGGRISSMSLSDPLEDDREPIA